MSDCKHRTSCQTCRHRTSCQTAGTGHHVRLQAQDFMSDCRRRTSSQTVRTQHGVIGLHGEPLNWCLFIPLNTVYSELTFVYPVKHCLVWLIFVYPVKHRLVWTEINFYAKVYWPSLYSWYISLAVKTVHIFIGVALCAAPCSVLDAIHSSLTLRSFCLVA